MQGGFRIMLGRRPSQSTRLGYNIWLDNPYPAEVGRLADRRFAGSSGGALAAVSAALAEERLHIRGVLSILWDYAMWRGDVPPRRNPMELVSIKGASGRVRNAVSARMSFTSWSMLSVTMFACARCCFSR